MELVSAKKSFLKTTRSFGKFLPVIFGVLLLVSLILTIIPREFYSKIFTDNIILDPLLGAVVGSISVGNPLVSYIIGGELTAEGVGLMAVTAFILSWISVGVFQIPAEAAALGKRFTIMRNVFSFVTALVIAVLVYFTISVI